MAEQYEDFRKAGAEVLTVVRDSREKASDYFEKNNLPYPCVVDPDHRIYDRYEVHSKLLSMGQRPALFVIDRQGVVRYAHLGWQQWEIPSNREVLDACNGVPCTT